jgi:hypothetical protein
MPATPTYVFDDDGKAYAYLAGKIVASADDIDELEEKLAGGHASDCGCGFCLNKGNIGQSKDSEEESETPDDEEEVKEAKVTLANATHIQTPNGLKGTILGKQRGLWGDQVTIRLENGRIAKFDVAPDSKVSYLKEETPQKVSAIPTLQERLAKTPDGTRRSLLDRLEELKSIKKDAAQLVTSAPYTDGETLDNMIVQADYEMREIGEALDALEGAQAFEAPAPFSTGVAEQASLGGNDTSWLERTVEDMVSENEAQDFDQLMDEGPDEFVSELETPVLQDDDLVTEYASEYVSSKTAGLDAEVVHNFRQAFVARALTARDRELEAREVEEGQQKEASTDTYDGPDEAIFF